MAIARVSAKLAGMRKPQEFVVYPRNDGSPDRIIVQSDRAIGALGPDGRGILNWRGSGPKYFVHLSRRLGAEPYTFPRSFVLMCQEARPNSGDLIGASPETGRVYVA